MFRTSPDRSYQPNCMCPMLLFDININMEAREEAHATINVVMNLKKKKSEKSENKLSLYISLAGTYLTHSSPKIFQPAHFQNCVSHIEPLPYYTKPINKQLMLNNRAIDFM